MSASRTTDTQRDAYARYVTLQWQLIRAPRADRARPALAALVVAADRRWRALSAVPDLRTPDLVAH